jgi:hypothetical protein
MLLAALVSWFDQRQQEAVAYLIEENRILRSHVSGMADVGLHPDRRRAEERGPSS